MSSLISIFSFTGISSITNGLKIASSSTGFVSSSNLKSILFSSGSISLVSSITGSSKLFISSCFSSSIIASLASLITSDILLPWTSTLFILLS